MGLFPKQAGWDMPEFPRWGVYNRVYCVSDVNGDDDNPGVSWDAPFATIQAAVNVARRLPGTTTIDDTKDHRALVMVAPGHYNEQVLFSGYNIDLVGMGPAVPGKDYGASINYDGAIDATAVVGFSGSGIRIANLHIYCAEAIPAVLCTAGDNNLLENVVIEGDGVNMTYGIQTYSLKGSWIRNCVVSGFATAGIFADGGADRYCIHGGIERNQLYSAVAGAVKGIYIENTMTAYNFRVFQNFIDLEACGATAKGIDNDAAGNIIIADNYVVMEAAATAIESASHGVLHNRASVNGTVTVELDDD